MLILLKNFCYSNFWLFFGSSILKHVFCARAIEAGRFFTSSSSFKQLQTPVAKTCDPPSRR
jgi:hypothetical protein